MADGGTGESVLLLRGVEGDEVKWFDTFLLCFLNGDADKESECLLEAFEELCDERLGLSFTRLVAPENIPSFLSAALLSDPNAASKVSARLCTP